MNLLNPQEQIMETNLQLLTIWLFAGLAFITASNMVAFFAVLASISTLIRNYPYVKEAFVQLCQKLNIKKRNP